MFLAPSRFMRQHLDGRILPANVCPGRGLPCYSYTKMPQFQEDGRCFVAEDPG
jgi:hypothetical protein